MKFMLSNSVSYLTFSLPIIKVLKIGSGIEPDKLLVQRFNGSTGI